jgi:hypothetical protein
VGTSNNPNTTALCDGSLTKCFGKALCLKFQPRLLVMLASLLLAGYPQPLSDTPTDDQQQQQQQPQQQPPQRLQQGITALDRARAMCKLLNMGNPGPLVTPETEASAINAFACGGFFR